MSDPHDDVVLCRGKVPLRHLLHRLLPDVLPFLVFPLLLWCFLLRANEMLDFHSVCLSALVMFTLSFSSWVNSELYRRCECIISVTNFTPSNHFSRLFIYQSVWAPSVEPSWLCKSAPVKRRLLEVNPHFQNRLYSHKWSGESTCI